MWLIARDTGTTESNYHVNPFDIPKTVAAMSSITIDSFHTQMQTGSGMLKASLQLLEIGAKHSNNFQSMKKEIQSCIDRKYISWSDRQMIN